MKKITFITALIAISFAFNLNAQFTIDPAAEYYIYSNGVDEGGAGKLGGNKYIYPISTTEVRWIEVADANIPAEVPANAKWKLSEVDGLVMFQNVANSQFLAKGVIPYVNGEAEATLNALALSATGDGFYIKPVPGATEKKAGTDVNIIQFSATDIHCFEVNHGGSGAKPAVATLNNTIQINNSDPAPTERSRFHWVIEKIGPNSVNVPNDTKEISNKLYFDILGKQVPASTKGLIIEKVTYVDGSQVARKIYVKQ